RIIGEEIEDQAMGVVLGARLHRQLPADQRIKQPVFGPFQFTPTGEPGRVGEIGHRSIVPAGATITGGLAGLEQPVGGMEAGIGAENTALASIRQRLACRAAAFDRRQRDPLWHERQSAAAAAAGAIFEIEDVCASLADKELQDGPLSKTGLQNSL